MRGRAVFRVIFLAIPVIPTMFFFFKAKLSTHAFYSAHVFLFQVKSFHPFLIFRPCFSFSSQNFPPVPYIPTMFFFFQVKLSTHSLYSSHVFLFQVKTFHPFLIFRPCFSFSKSNCPPIPYILTMFFFL